MTFARRLHLAVILTLHDWRFPFRLMRVLPSWACWRVCRRIERPPFAVWFAAVGAAERIRAKRSRVRTMNAAAAKCGGRSPWYGAYWAARNAAKGGAR